MAGIDYLSTDGSGVRAWSAVLTDPAEAWDAGGQPPVWIVHREHRALPRDFARTLVSAVAEAVRATRVPQPEAVIADLRVAICEEAAIVRIGPEASAVVRAGAYKQFVQHLAAALGRGGAPAAAVLEPRHLNASALDDLVPDSAAFVVSPDADASITRLVELRQASAAGQDAAALHAECERLRISAWAQLSPPVVAWLPEPSSPLFGRTPPPVMYPQLAVRVSSNAALPPHGAHHAETWLDLVLNGGKHGLDRALSEVTGSRRIGAIAVARRCRSLPCLRRRTTGHRHPGRRAGLLGLTGRPGAQVQDAQVAAVNSLLAFGQRTGYLPLNVGAAVKLPQSKVSVVKVDTDHLALRPLGAFGAELPGLDACVLCWG